MTPAWMRRNLLLEYSLPATGERVDALIVGREVSGRLCTVAIALKQWTRADFHLERPGMVRTGERIVQHPARQVGGYVDYLQQWVSREEFPLTVRGAAVLHDAPAGLIAKLRASADRGPASAYLVLGRDDLTPTPSAQDLAQRLGCADLQPASRTKSNAFSRSNTDPRRRSWNEPEASLKEVTRSPSSETKTWPARKSCSPWTPHARRARRASSS
ncbi:hypothetical protein [Streptomyces sp. NPDC017993]|uniref:hypothetical protein n=1 Tax=Streptomyces sp. NPDC017993 TaxID=3365027 RepID=UPI00378DDB6C